MLYNTLLILASPLWGGYLFQRYLSGKSRTGWRERWGHLPTRFAEKIDRKPRIWIHAVSAGEVVAAVPITREVRTLLPDFELFFSVTTSAGMEIAEQQARPFVDALFFFPFDLPWVVHRVVSQVRPRVFVSLESELWPNVLHELKRHNAWTVMVNGRISERNFRRARGAGAGLFRWMLSNMDRMLMQSGADAERIGLLAGITGQSERIHVLGNSKFDQEIPFLSTKQVLELRRSLKFPDDVPIFVAGSTRSAEEEAQVLRAYLEMRSKAESLCLLIAPRQINRAEDLAEAMRTLGLQPVRKTAVSTVGTVRHLILDTMGDLATVYAIADFAFVGNTIGPVVKGGGQNLLQPLAHGKPVFFGPKTATIRSEVDLAMDAGVGFRVANAEQLAAGGIRLLANPRELFSISERARNLIASQQGVSTRYAQAIADLALYGNRGDSRTDSA